jgi:hypothetical protein
MAILNFPSFAKGEVAPSIYGRVDTAAYHVAVAKAYNANVHPYGGISNRPGTSFIGQCKEHTYAPRLIPFQFKTSDQYILEFGNLYMRAIRNDAYVTQTPLTTCTATAADPVVVTKTGHLLSSADEVQITGMTEMTELNGNRYNITVLDANTFSLQHQVSGVDIDGSAWAAETTGGSVAEIFEIVTPYATADLDNIKFTQSSDTMTLTHSSYPAQDLTRTDHNLWTIAPVTFTPTQGAPTGTRVVVNTSGTETREYAVTALTQSTFEESLTGLATSVFDITAATKANPCVVTCTSHSFLDGDTVKILYVEGMTELNGNEYVVANKTANTFELTGIDSTAYTTYTSGGDAFKSGWVVSAVTKANPCVVTITGHPYNDGDEIQLDSLGGMVELNARRFTVSSADTNTVTLLGLDSTSYTTYTSGGVANKTSWSLNLSNETEDNTISWIVTPGAEKYAIYRREQGIWGLIGESHTNSFLDENFAPDSGIGPPIFSDPMSLTDTYPGATSYFQQRQCFGGSVDKPDTVYYSRIADRKNMSSASPATPSDSFSTTLASQQVNEIRHFVPQNDLLVLTSGSEWQIGSGSDSAFELASIRQKPQSFWGSSHLRPQNVGNITFFVEENKSIIRSLGYSFQLDGYTGTNIGLLANHLLQDNTITDWHSMISPEVRVMMVRNDGIMLTYTYDNEQEVIAWTTWGTDGTFERVSGLSHSSTGTQDQVYMVVKRTINGYTSYYVEKLAEQMTSFFPEDAYYVDCGLSLDTPLTISGVTAADPVVVTATGSNLTDGDLVDIEGIVWEPNIDVHYTETQPIQAIGRYRIAEATANTFELSSTSGIQINAITEAADGSITTVVDHGLAVGDEIHFHDIQGMTELNGNGHAVKAITSPKVFTIEQDTTGYTTYTTGGTVHMATDGSAWNAYKSGGNVRVAVLTISGLDHLEGETLVANLDGNVSRGLVVSGGAITFPNNRAYSRAHIGLPYVTDIETLDIEPKAATTTLQGTNKKIANVTIKFNDSRGAIVGPVTGRLKLGSTGLVEMKQREFERLGEPTRLLTGQKTITLKPTWNSNGKILVRQKDPMPLNIVAIIPEVFIGDLSDV